ncbi:MAG: rhamnan synthesis F family protein [Bacteroidota bacterium]
MKDSKLICLFAHFNDNNQVEQYVFTYLEHLSDLGFEIFFISNSVIEQEYKDLLIEKISNCRIFERENKGLDFGAWQWVLENNLIPEDVDSLLLTNSSIYGTLFPLTPIFEVMLSKTDVDFWGLTDCYEGAWHIQSYFLWIPRKVFISEAFKKVFSQDFSKLDKSDIIQNGERQLTKSLSDAGFKGAAYIPYGELNPGFEDWDTKNPTQFFWDYLIEKFNFPFIKRELVLQNPENIQNIDNLFSLIQKHSSYSIDNIKQSISNYLASYNSSNTFPDTISVLCHLYYPGSIYYFLTRILLLKSPQTQFVFNLSFSLYHNAFFCEMLTKYFPDAMILYTPNQGRDIGAKLAAFDALTKAGIETAYTLVIHDKLSPHTPTGVEWRNKLLRIILPDELQKIFRKFQENKEVGVIVNKESIQNEFVPEQNKFTCTSNANLLNYIKEYNLNITDYRFAAGSIFWIRTEILRNFFSSYSPLSVRKEFEKGNSLDFNKGTNIHAWERLFSLIANSQGFKTIGI